MPFLLYQIVRNLTFSPISPDSSSFRFYKYLSLLFFYWSIPVFTFNSIGSYFFLLWSSDKLFIRAEFLTSLCTEDSMLSETAVCNFSHFYRCSMWCFLTWKFIPFWMWLYQLSKLVICIFICFIICVLKWMLPYNWNLQKHIILNLSVSFKFISKFI